jgi:hypothetical protein
VSLFYKSGIAADQVSRYGTPWVCNQMDLYNL